MSADSDRFLLITALQAAVPLRIAEYRSLTFAQRQKIAAEAGGVIASQGDTLQYGGSAKFGAGARQQARHDAHAHLVTKDNREEYQRKCHVCRCGQPAYSAGEVFGWLARGLAVAAYQRGA